MIQLNLLPDVKTKYIKAQRSKRLIILTTVAVTGVSLGIVVLLASVVYGAQKIQLSYLDNKIQQNTAALKKIDGLDKILTIQNQLNSITKLHDDKPVVSRLFTFLPQITPNDVQISTLNVDLASNTMQLQGSAKSLEAINKFVDTLKFTKYTSDANASETPAFSTVVLTSFGRTDKGASYSITMGFDPAIFNSANKTVTLVVPKITSTRSQTEQPNALFKEQETQTQQ